MSKKKWWQLGSWAGNEIDEKKFSNTIQKHNQKLENKGIQLIDDSDVTYHDYDYGWNKKLQNSSEFSSDEDMKINSKKEFDLNYSNYALRNF